MKLCVIPPLNHLELANYGTADFILAQFVLEYDEYADFYASRDTWKIMDNGAYEERQSLDTDELLEAVARVQPNVVVVPDIPREPEASFTLSKNFLEEVSQSTETNCLWMVVPHGENVQEFMRYVEKFIALRKELKWDYIGLSILDLYKWNFRARPLVVREIHYLSRVHGFYIHLLGLDEPVELQAYRGMDIESVDTSLPITRAARGERIHFMTEWKPLPRIDLQKTRLTRKQYELAVYNIRVLRTLCDWI